MNILHSKKFRHGSVSLSLTVAIIAVVILVNAIFSALANKFLWFIDMTAEQIYSLTDDAKELLDTMNKDAEAEIIFCSERDVLEANSTQRYALYTALDVADYCDNVRVRYVDTVTNPSAVNKYKIHTGQDINSQSVIIASGSECRVYSLSALYSYDSSTQEVIGYNGEQRIVSGLLAVTQEEMPVAAVTVNHGEADNPNLMSLLQLLYETGYEIKEIDLAKEEISDKTRLLVVYDPQSDFKVKNALSDVDELAKIDRFMDARNAMMVFFDHETPVLPNFEEFLDEWGIAIARDEEANLLVRDDENSLDAQSRHNIVGQYVTGQGLGSDITKKLTGTAQKPVAVPKSVVFPFSSVIRSTYEQTYINEFEAWAGAYNLNGVQRVSYDVFTASSAAVAMANGVELSAKEVEALGLQDPAKVPMSLMKITRETFFDQATNTETYANLLACASTNFVTQSALNTSYGNHAVLAYACSIMGRETVAVSLNCKYFASTEITNVTASEANQYTVVLTVVPAAIIFVVGVYFMVRRRYA